MAGTGQCYSAERREHLPALEPLCPEVDLAPGQSLRVEWNSNGIVFFSPTVSEHANEFGGVSNRHSDLPVDADCSGLSANTEGPWIVRVISIG